MTSLYLGQTCDADTPGLEVVIARMAEFIGNASRFPGWLDDPDYDIDGTPADGYIEYAVYSVHATTGARTQVLPRTDLDLEANRIGLGRYAIPWTVPPALGATWTAAWATGVATFTNAADHHLVQGQTVVTTGFSRAGYNGTLVITGVTAKTFTVAIAIDPTGAATGGTVSIATGLYVFCCWWVLPGATDADGEAVEIEHAFEREFEVTSANLRLDRCYCLLADLRAEGITEARLGDQRAASAIRRMTARIDDLTGQSFIPTYGKWTFDAERGGTVPMRQPLIALEAVEIAGDYDTPLPLRLDEQWIHVYNRHLYRMISPDDRQDPHLELEADLRPYPQGITMTGLVGWTDADGSADGCTPDDIRRACIWMVARAIATIGSGDTSDADAAYVLSESTSRQSVTFDSRRIGDGPTGNREIDAILNRHTINTIARVA